MVKIPSVSWFVAYPHFVLMFEWTEWTCSKSLKLSRKVWSFMNSHSSSSLNVVLAVWLAAQTWRLHQARVNGQLASDPLFSAVTLTDWTTSVFFFSLLQWIVNQSFKTLCHLLVPRSWIQGHRPPAPQFTVPVQRQDVAFKPFKKDRLQWANHHLHREAARPGKDVSDIFWFWTVQSDQSVCIVCNLHYIIYSITGKDKCIINYNYSTLCGCVHVLFWLVIFWNADRLPWTMGFVPGVIARVRLDSRPTLSRCVWLPPLHLSLPFPSHRLAPVQVNAR